METTLTELEIKILMRCQKGTISRRMATQCFKSAGKLERDKALANFDSKWSFVKQEAS